ncbi:MAG: HU family DNA-binding protein [Candidatus Tectomicrobia bacterium]|uniref:HU family DNA-binding protein n=1 Tax=Tectimicrobiota bacterium TaxID=2528274 RepID=A0A932CQV4_UNCTE|nr:HU family DNA-binding protein [Candidatus Tectomicrobia bacterium]
MNKTELVAEIAKEADITKVKAEKALNAVISGIKTALSKEDSVTLVGFGTFSVAKRSDRKGRNPQTGEEILIPASRTPKFKPGKALKDAIK